MLVDKRRQGTNSYNKADDRRRCEGENQPTRAVQLRWFQGGLRQVKVQKTRVKYRLKLVHR